MVQPAHLVVIRELQKTYQDGDTLVQVLKGLNLEVLRGHVTALTGPSGSGKSTLLNLIAGIVGGDGGRVELHLQEGVIDVCQLSQKNKTKLRRQHIGYVHQFFNLVPTLTVLENVMLPVRLNKKMDPLDPKLLLDRCGMSHRLHAFPEQLSGGEQQRAAVARALVHKPQLVLADEPTGNLDKQNSQEVAQLLTEAAREFGATLLVATHSSDLAEQADAVHDLSELQAEVIHGP